MTAPLRRPLHSNTYGFADVAARLGSLPESGAAFIQGFVAAVVRQKEADGFEVVDTYFARHLDDKSEFDLEGKPPSMEGGACALCTGTLAPQSSDICTAGYSGFLDSLCVHTAPLTLKLRLCAALHRGLGGRAGHPAPQPGAALLLPASSTVLYVPRTWFFS